MFSLPSIPTDNLYKFISIFSLVIGIVVLVYTQLRQNDYSIEQMTYVVEKMKLELTGKSIDADFVDIKKESKIFIESTGMKAKWDSTSIGYFHMVSDNNPAIAKWSSEINDRVNRYYRAKDDYNQKATDLANKQLVLDNHKEQLSLIENIQKWLLPISGISMIVGFVLWYYKVQYYQDAILKEQYKASKSKDSTA